MKRELDEKLVIYGLYILTKHLYKAFIKLAQSEIACRLLFAYHTVFFTHIIHVSIGHVLAEFLKLNRCWIRSYATLHL